MGKNTIKCYAHNSLGAYQYHLFIYNLENELVLEKKVKDNDPIYFELPFGIYRIKMIISDFIPRAIYKTSFLNFRSRDQLVLAFDFPIFQKKSLHSINMKVTDRNYQGLPIMKGEIYLWPNPM